MLHCMSNYIPWGISPVNVAFSCLVYLYSTYGQPLNYCMFLYVFLDIVITTLLIECLLLTILYISILNGVFVSVNPNTAVILFFAIFEMLA